MQRGDRQRRCRRIGTPRPVRLLGPRVDGRSPGSRVVIRAGLPGFPVACVARIRRLQLRGQPQIRGTASPAFPFDPVPGNHQRASVMASAPARQSSSADGMRKNVSVRRMLSKSFLFYGAFEPPSRLMKRHIGGAAIAPEPARRDTRPSHERPSERFLAAEPEMRGDPLSLLAPGPVQSGIFNDPVRRRARPARSAGFRRYDARDAERARSHARRIRRAGVRWYSRRALLADSATGDDRRRAAAAHRGHPRRTRSVAAVVVMSW